MADAAKKAQKLAAARKKLKEFQQKSVKSNKNDEYPASSVTTTNSSRHSSISNDNTIDFTTESVPFETNYQQSSPLHNYFNGNEQNDFYVENQRLETINFFDTLPVQPNTNLNINLFEPSSEPERYQMHSKVDMENDVESLDYPEVESRSVYGFYPKEEHPTITSEDAKRLSEFLGSSNGPIIQGEQNLHLQIDHSTFDVSQGLSTQLLNNESHSEQQPLTFDVLAATIESECPNSDASTEILIPTKIDSVGLSRLPNNVHDLELQLEEYQVKLKHLEDKLEQNRMEYEHRISTDMSSLQGHVKTIEMYIAETNGLSNSLSQSQIVVNQKIVECDELQGRLKTSRSRVVDLEKELQAVKAEKAKLDQTHVYQAEMSHLKQQCEELKHTKEETTQDLLELREKLNIKANENIGLQRELQDITHQLSLAQIKIEQITAGENVGNELHTDILTKQQAELEKKVQDLTQNLKTTNDEKAQMNLQYQHYVQQLNTQVATLINKLETITIENENLSKREQSLIKHIGELEKHLQSIQEEKTNFSVNKSGSVELKKELDAALELIEILRKEKDELQEKYEHTRGDQDDLITELATKKDILEQLENELERLKVDQPNNIKLLATLESDKVAASRAVAQNTTLKQELEEMQQAFVRMSNDKLNLTEQLSTEQFKNHELQERIIILETQVHTLTDAIEIKDNELTHIRETLSHKNKQLLQNDQLTDRLRHYEATDGSSSALHEDLQRAHYTINELMEQNMKLKSEALLHDHVIHVTETSEFNEIETSSDQLDFSKLNNTLDKEAAMKHLEEKFTRTMAEIANLIEEKQRLEHIILQLQGETDTIGEYIALYQHQRGILQQRTLEKEEQLKKLTDDRVNVRNKIETINGLVRKLVHEKGVLLPEVLEQHELNNEQANESLDNSHNVPLIMEEGENNNISSETADHILQLLSEIKSSNLIQPCDAFGNFHPCSCCSGQLFTV